MNAMILAAGFGMRLRPMTGRLPKPLFPIGRKRLIDIAIEKAINAGAEKIVINVSHLGSMIDAYLADKDYGVPLVILHEAKVLGTAGGIKNAEKELGDQSFLVINSDILFDPDFESLIEYHNENRPLATLCLIENKEPEKYGHVRTLSDDNGQIGQLVEFKAPGYEPSGSIKMFSGVSVVSPEIFKLIEPGREVDITKEVYGPLLERGGDLHGFSSRADWIDIGQPEDFLGAALKALDEDDFTPSTIWGELRNIKIVPPVYIETGAEISGRTTIGPYVAVYDGAKIGEGARLSGSVILPGSTVDSDAVIDNEIV